MAGGPGSDTRAVSCRVRKVRNNALGSRRYSARSTSTVSFAGGWNMNRAMRSAGLMVMRLTGVRAGDTSTAGLKPRRINTSLMRSRISDGRQSVPSSGLRIVMMSSGLIRSWKVLPRLIWATGLVHGPMGSATLNRTVPCAASSAPGSSDWSSRVRGPQSTFGRSSCALEKNEENRGPSPDDRY